VHFELSEPPDGIALRAMSTTGRQSIDLTFSCDAAKAAAGLQGNLIVQAFLERPGPGADDKKEGPRRTPIGPLPSIPFVIVAR
jgi:hypothetical protein